MWIFRTLVAKFVLIAVPIFMVLNALLLLWYHDRRHDDLHAELGASVAADATTIAQVARSYLAEGRGRDLKPLLGMLAGNRAIQCLEIVTLDNDQVASWPGFDCSLSRDPGRLEIPVSTDQKILGHVLVAYSDEWAVGALNREIAFVYIATALAALGAFAACMLAHRMTIGRPLGRLLSAIRVKSETGTAERVKFSGRDEFARVIDAYNKMLDSEAILARERQEADRLSEEARREEAVARAANVAKTQFLATISHELRTPINGIVGLCDLLIVSDLTGDQREKLELLGVSASDLAHLVQDILQFSQLEAGEMSITAAPFDLSKALSRVEAQNAAAAIAKGLRLTVSPIDRKELWLDGDETRLVQILNNLVGNAVKFTETGSVDVVTEVERRDGVARLKISVRDTGLGIPVDETMRIFERFRQLDVGHGRKHQGVGLGLAITKKLMELMKGSVRVVPAPEGGACFEISVLLPLTARPSDHKPRVNATTQCWSILVVEDSETNQYVLRAMLESGGHRVEIVDNGIEAIDAVSNQSFDFILMDIQLPGIDGLETARRIRSLGGRSAETPIIALSANAFSHDIDAAMAAGMDSFLAKPVRKADLLESISRVQVVAKGPNSTNVFQIAT